MLALITQHKLVSVLILLLVLGGAWYGLSSSSNTPAPLITTTSNNSSSADQTLVNTLLTLRAVTLSGTIFNDPAFRALQDFSTQLVPEPVGRPNPFSPLSGVSASTSTSPAAKNTQLFAPKNK